MMKKILLFAIIALSINAFAQNKRTSDFRKHPGENAIENIQNRMINAGLKTHSINSGSKAEKAILHLSVSDPSLIQVMDSLYSWSWDTISSGWKLDTRMINVVYDASNNMINSTDQNWTGTAWVNSEHYIYTYDANHNMISELSKVWNNNAWINDIMSIWTYDANGNETSILTKSWDGSVWVNEGQTFYVYDANNNETSMVLQSWAGSAWENSFKITHTYDANNNITSIINLGWNGSDWEESMKESFTYDANSNKLTSLTQMWLGVEWFDMKRITYTYENNNLISEISENWNFIEWENGSRTDYTYDANNNMVSETEQEWDEGNWVNSQKAFYTYDGNKNLTGALVQLWDGSTWLNFYQMNYGFDANNFVKFLAWKNWEKDGTFVSWGDSIYVYYHTVVTATHGLRSDDLTVYPNPSKGRVTISGYSNVSAIEIYNLTGVQIYSDHNIKQQTSKEIDLTGYAKGVYIMKIYSGTKSYSRKIIVQ